MNETGYSSTACVDILGGNTTGGGDSTPPSPINIHAHLKFERRVLPPRFSPHFFLKHFSHVCNRPGVDARQRAPGEVDSAAAAGTSAAEDGPLLAVLGAHPDTTHAVLLAPGALARLHLVHHCGERDRAA